MDYYVVQQYCGTFDSDLDLEWRNMPQHSNTLVAGLKAYREVLFSKRLADTRLVKAFYCQKNKKQLIREVLEYHQAKIQG